MTLAILYFTSYVLNMFRTLIYPSSGACDCSVKTEDLALANAKSSVFTEQ